MFSHNNNKNPSGPLSDTVHRLMQGVLYFQTVTHFYSTHVNVFSFMPASNVPPSPSQSS